MQNSKLNQSENFKRFPNSSHSTIQQQSGVNSVSIIKTLDPTKSKKGTENQQKIAFPDPSQKAREREIFTYEGDILAAIENSDQDDENEEKVISSAIDAIQKETNEQMNEVDIMIDQVNELSADLSENSRNKNVVQNKDVSQVGSPLAQYNYEFEEMMNPPGQKSKPKVKRQLKHANIDKQPQNQVQTKQDPQKISINVSNFDKQEDQNVNIIGNNYNTGKVNFKQEGEEHDNNNKSEYNTDQSLLKPMESLSTLKRKNVDHAIGFYQEENSQQEMVDKFDVDYNQKKMHLDDKRSRMFVINSIISATVQRQAGNEDFFMIIDKTPLEKIDDFTGRCVKIKQLIWIIKTQTTHLAFYIISNKIFDAISLSVIFLNSVMLAAQDPAAESTYFFNIMDDIFLTFYTSEMMIKIIGLGFIFNKGSYLRDPWNILDFVIVSSGLLQVALQGGSVNLSAMRSFRVLRPLKTISGIEGLRVIVAALLKSAKLLFESFIVLYFAYLIFSVAGLQLFMGLLKKQCINIETGQTFPTESEFNQCGGVGVCPDGYVCGKTNQDPNWDQSNFNTIFYSFIMVFASVSLEGWTAYMKYTQLAYTNYVWAYYCPIVFLVSFFLIQLTQAVITSKFAEEHNRTHDAGKQKKIKRQHHEFESLNEEEQKKLISAQTGARLEVLKKWKKIMFLKSQMRVMIKQFRDRKKQEEQQKFLEKQRHLSKQYGLAGLPGFTLQEQLNYESILGYERDQSMISQRTNMNEVLSMKLFSSPGKDMLGQKIIMEDDQEHNEIDEDEAVKERKKINKNRENLLEIQTMFKNKVANDPNTLKSLNLMNNVIFRNGVPQNDSVRGYMESDRNNGEGQLSFRTRIDINEEFFEEFIRAELSVIEQNFSVDQLKEIIENIEGGNDFLKTIDENLEDNLDVHSFSHLSYTSDENGKLTNRFHYNQTEKRNISDSSDENENDDNKNNFSSTNLSQQYFLKKQISQVEKSKQISIDDQINQRSLQNKHYKHKSNMDEIYKSQDNHRVNDIDNHQTSFNTSQIALLQDQKNRTRERSIEHRNKYPSMTTTTNYQGTNANEQTHITESRAKFGFNKNITKDDRIVKKFVGQGSIEKQDFIPIEKSMLNNKFLVNDDIGKHKKIYVRRDKFDFVKPSIDIFELREKQRREQIEEQLKQESIDYLSNIKIQPFSRKCFMQPTFIILSNQNKELLKSQTLDVTDVEYNLQKQYNRAFLSQLFVTGTLSIVLGDKKLKQTNKVWKLQSKRSQNETKENVVLRFVVQQYLPNTNISRSGKQKIEAPSITPRMTNSNQISISGVDSGIVKASKIDKSQTSNQLNQMKRRTTSNIQQLKKMSMRVSGLNQDTQQDEKMKKEMILMKKANKDHQLQKRITMVKIQKDCLRSNIFRTNFIKRRNEFILTGQKDKLYEEDDLKDSDEEENNFEDDDEDEEAKLDDFFLDFDCKTEVFRSKKQALQKKISRVQWSGQDTLHEFDPQEALVTTRILDDIRVWPQGIWKYPKFIQVHSKNFVMGTFMDNLMLICVLANTVCLAIDHYGIDEATESFLTDANLVFTYVFITEMALKLIGLGVLKYLKDKMNYVDGTVVLLSIVELTLASGGSQFSAFRSVRIFRTFRVLRITRLLRAMKDMTAIINALGKSMTSLMYLYLLMFLFIVIFSLLGMQIYGGNLNFEDNGDGFPGVPRQNYDSFFWAFQVTFQLLTQENWQGVLYDTLRSPYVNRYLTMIYHIAWMTLGNTTLLNLLMAIMLDSFNTDDDEEELNTDKFRKKHLQFMKSQEGEKLILYFQESKGTAYQLSVAERRKNEKQKDENLLDESFDLGEDFNLASMKKKKVLYEGNFCELSWYLFNKNNPIRLFLYWFINLSAFENTIQILILLSTIKLVGDSYTKNMPPDALFVQISEYLDYFFTAAFALESLLKALALGFVMDKGTYLRESWSQLDFFIVITSLIDASFANIDLPFLKVLRLLRTLRPLRVISHNSEMKTIINGLIYSVTGIFYVAILLLVVWIMFAIIGVNLMGGKFRMCSVDPYVNTTPSQCQQSEGRWFNWYFNYDDVIIGLISLFTVATLEAWPDQRNIAGDMTHENNGPIRNNSTFYSYFFIAFIMIGVYCFLNLLIGVIFIKFEQAQKEEKESTLLDDQQFRWLDMLNMIVKATPDLETTNVPKNRWRRMIHEIVTGQTADQKPGQELPINKFELFIMTAIVLNMVQMCMVFDSASDYYLQQLNYANYAFSAIFIVEAGLKLLAFGLTYFKNSWNQFDFIIVLTSFADIAMDFLDAETLQFLKVGPQIARILRVLRVSRLFRLIKKYKSLNALLQTIILSLPSLMNVFALFMLVYFIYAILATFLFTDITTGMIIDDMTNFSNFGKAMLTLIRASTGEDWNYIMYDCTKETNCISGKTCGTVVAWPFFISFMSIQSFIMMNLFILVIIQQFDKYYLSKGNILEQFKDDLAVFKGFWTYYTREFNCQRMKDTKIVVFFQSMDKPLGMKGDSEDDVMRNLIKMDIEADQEGFYYFNDILFKTMKQLYCNRPIKNKLLAVSEYIAFQKVIMIQEKIKQANRQKLRMSALKSNPFIMKMYRNISVKLWLKLYRKNQPRREQDLLDGNGEISDAEIVEPDIHHNENAEYYYETEVDESVSESDSNDNEECLQSDSSDVKQWSKNYAGSSQLQQQSNDYLVNRKNKFKAKIESMGGLSYKGKKRRNSAEVVNLRRSTLMKDLKKQGAEHEMHYQSTGLINNASNLSIAQNKLRNSCQARTMPKLHQE